ncbi:hypothetical protein BDF19DRAFT_157759 [Syncephalis fuscata]|nr:hypothetical protein BDF19DRAFT_157759 [Syncephalis fuscata]
MSSSASIAESVPPSPAFGSSYTAFPTSYRFEDNFWSPGGLHDGDITDYRMGLDVLYQKMQQGCIECEDIADFLRQRIGIEELYANKLKELSALKLNPQGFGRDDGASLRRTFENVKSESEQLGHCHRQLADNITVMVLQPLMRFAEDHQRRVRVGMEELNGSVRDFEKQIDVLDRAHDDYLNKCEVADHAESVVMAEKSRLHDVDYMIENPRTAFVRLGPLSFSTERDLDAFLGRLQQNIPMEDVRYSLFGVYRHSVNGELLAQWLLQSCRDHLKTLRAAEEVGQAMIDNGYLKVVGMGGTFQARPNYYYQWRRLAADPDEEEHRKLRAVADEADDVYHQAVSRVEQSRMLVEQRLMSYYNAMNHAERERIEEVRSAFTNLAVALSNVMTVTQAVCDRMVVYLEAMRTDFDMQYFVQQYRTGPYAPRPMVYESYYHSPASDQIFGISIEEQARVSQTKIPPFVAKCLSLIEKELHALPDETKQRMWIAPLQLPIIHRLRGSVNTGQPVTLKQLRQFDLNTVVGALRLYLMELPECLCTYNLYEPVKALYRKSGDNIDARFVALRSMLTTMPTANFHTLNRIVSHLYNLALSTSADDEYLASLGMSLGPSFLRPEHMTRVNFHDRHPQRLVRDLITAFRLIFSPTHRHSIVSLSEYNLNRDSQDLSTLAPNVRKRIQEAVASHMSDRSSINSDTQSTRSPYDASFTESNMLTEELLSSEPVDIDDSDNHSVSTSWDSDNEEMISKMTESQATESLDMVAMINTVSSSSIMEMEAEVTTTTTDVAIKRSMSSDSNRDIEASLPVVQARDISLTNVDLSSPETVQRSQLSSIPESRSIIEEMSLETTTIDESTDIRRESAHSFQNDINYDPEEPISREISPISYQYEEHSNEHSYQYEEDTKDGNTTPKSYSGQVIAGTAIAAASITVAINHLQDPSSLEEPSPNSSDDESDEVRQKNREAALAALMGSFGNSRSNNDGENDSETESESESHNPLESVLSPTFSIYERARLAMQNKQQQQEEGDEDADTTQMADTSIAVTVNNYEEEELNAMQFTPTSAGLVPRLEFTIFEPDHSNSNSDIEDMDFDPEGDAYQENDIDDELPDTTAPSTELVRTSSAASSILWFSDSESGEDDDLEDELDVESTTEIADIVARQDSPDSAATSLSEAEPVVQAIVDTLREKALNEVDANDSPVDSTDFRQ